jgi:hypothetical protein
VLEHVTIERIERGMVNVGREHALAQVIGHTTRVAPPKRRNAFSCNSAQTRELERNTRRRTAFQLYPSVRTNNRVRRLLGRLRVAHHRAGAIIDLSFFVGCGLNDHVCFRVGDLRSFRTKRLTLE